MSKEKILNKAKKVISEYLIGSTAIATVTLPIYAGLETFGAHMTIEDSVSARKAGVFLTYAGLGWVYNNGMKISRKLFGVKKETKERIKHNHDTAYAIGFNLTTSPLFYYILGQRDWSVITYGTLLGTVVGLFGGGLVGYSIDGFRDLIGVESSERVPKIIREANPTLKKGLAAALVASSIVLTDGVYKLNRAWDNYKQRDLTSCVSGNYPGEKR
jgi:hypothetical protein